MMTNKHWKSIERRIARIFGSERTPLSGSNSRHTESDCLHEALYIEVKYRKRIPFLKTFKESLGKAKKEKKTALVVFVERGSATPIVMCNIHDLKKIASQVKNGG